MVTFPEKPVRLAFSKRRKEKKKWKLKISEMLQNFSRARPAHYSREVAQMAYLPNTEQSCLGTRPIPADKSWDLPHQRIKTGEMIIGDLHLRRGLKLDCKKGESKWVNCLSPATVSPCARGVSNALAIDFCPKAVVLFFFSSFFLLFFLFLFFFFLSEARLVHTKLNNTDWNPLLIFNIFHIAEQNRQYGI